MNINNRLNFIIMAEEKDVTLLPDAGITQSGAEGAGSKDNPNAGIATESFGRGNADAQFLSLIHI